MVPASRCSALRRGPKLLGPWIVVAVSSSAAAGYAQTPPSPAASPSVETSVGKLTATGYVEAYWAWNFRQPSNGISNYVGFANRHNTFSISNAALGGTWENGPVSGKLMLQVGSTPSTYYSAEPSLAGAAGANASGADLWKYIQEAYVGYKAPLGRGLLIQAGVFLSPIGPESVAVKDNWNYTRSNEFFGLPYYHTGVRASYELSERWTVTLHVYNGWNSVVDNNDGKSLAASATYKAPSVTLQALYFGGVERPKGAPEGQPWRSVFDAYAIIDATSRLSFIGHADAGFEVNTFGTHSWLAGAAYARLQVLEPLFVALRGDVFREKLASNANGSSSPIFWPSEWVSSFTGTVEARPLANASFRLEYRHDEAQGPTYFAGNVAGDGSPSAPFVPSSKSQDTLLLGAVTHF
jgi:hypothetical protein